MPRLVKVDPEDPRATAIASEHPQVPMADREDETEWPIDRNDSDELDGPDRN